MVKDSDYSYLRSYCKKVNGKDPAGLMSFRCSSVLSYITISSHFRASSSRVDSFHGYLVLALAPPYNRTPREGCTEFCI